MTVKELYKRIIRKILRFVMWFFIYSTIYLIICKWVMPPINITQLVSFFQGYGISRDHVRLGEISPAVKLAAMASEDQLFPDHNGFDWKSIEKSLQQKPTKRKKTRGAGASTISQQVAKNVFLWQGSGIFKYIRKIPEMYYTFMIELVWGKERILEVYLNEAEMGKGIFGIEAAANTYFGKSAKSLNRIEAAKIIACLPNPKKYTVKPMSNWVNYRHQRIIRQMNNISDDPDVQRLLVTPANQAN
jgi:monofunctional biosynthetic peptidoglycan transglycosylase